MEKILKPRSGYWALILGFLLIVGLVPTVIATENIFLAIPVFITVVVILKGIYMINPNESKVMNLFGKYVGTVRDNGLFWINPFYNKQKISLRARNFDSERVKVNDKMGNPIMISVILVWKVSDTYKSAYEVDNYESFVRVQTDAAVRKLAGQYPYDNFDDEMIEITLRSGVEEVNTSLERELDERLSIAGIEILEARIGYLAYAPEIASAMLRRQQAEAIVAARVKIVEGAVGMVEIALEQLSEKGLVDLDSDKKATMVSNLMVVLCSDKDATPVVNTGSLYT